MDIDNEILMKLPKWTHNKVMFLKGYAQGSYLMIMERLANDYRKDDEFSTVRFSAVGMVELKKMLALYRKDYSRQGQEYYNIKNIW